MLRVEDISRPGLLPVSFALAPGCAVAVTGPSGAGKSLLLRAVADLDPNEGDVWIDGTERRAVPAPQWRGMAGYVPAESGWWADTVSAHFSSGLPDEAALQRIGLPAGARDWPVARLSTGERQRLSLLRMLLIDPPVLLLDEPSASLDAEATQRVEAELRRHLAAGGYLVFASHDSGQVERLADFILPISNGRAGEIEAVG